MYTMQKILYDGPKQSSRTGKIMLQKLDAVSKSYCSISLNLFIFKVMEWTCIFQVESQ